MVSLKSTLLRQLIAVTALIIALYTLLLYSWFFSGVHFANHEFMTRDAQRYKAWYEQDPNINLPVHQNFAVYLGFTSLPSDISKHFIKEALEPDVLTIGEINKDRFGKPESVILLMPTKVNNNKRWLYVVNMLKVSENASPTQGLFKVVILCAIVILLLMAGFAARLYAIIIKPMNALAALAQKAVNHCVVTDSALLEVPNEFGSLARTFELSVNQINKRNLQEKHFLQNLSHELRTPIAVIKTALELIDKRLGKGNYDIQNQLNRLGTANQQMQDLSETMLHLARKGEKQPLQCFEFAPFLDLIWQDLAYINNQQVELICQQPMQSELTAPRELVTILLVNLLLNAIEHSKHHTIWLSLKDNKLKVSNHTDALCQQKLSQWLERGTSSRQGFGLGLDIIRQICQNQRWQLNLQYDDPLLSVEVCFIEQQKANPQLT